MDIFLGIFVFFQIRYISEHQFQALSLYTPSSIE